ncbi:hypothetical protein ECH_0361 [Ehrlichia chaffeensis str. Arkansas]|uniref:Uncharacterized protein n=1 Tax=Ehrlichia chaffeensis (strain ATCC CRL-10679 / Arkansas) TaxID=205920 RepID=Q2GHA2_EHRCR|nr:hypothetical protein ECH_0361 [Ehrlichia chaffeensis str. Arkansas]
MYFFKLIANSIFSLISKHILRKEFFIIVILLIRYKHCLVVLLACIQYIKCFFGLKNI